MGFVVAAAIGVGILVVGLWAVRLLATPPPPEPDPSEIVDVEIDYRCSVCGLRLVVIHAADTEVKAPRHCREDMDPVR